MDYFKQILYEMRHQKMMTWVSISGTALSIFLVMTLFMKQQINVVAVAPETNISRILTGENIEAKSTDPEHNWTMGNSLSYKYAQEFYSGLEGVEKVSYMSGWPESVNVGLKGKKTVPLTRYYTDEEYWQLYDFTFLHGKPYDRAACESGEKKVVITRSTARLIFKDEDVVGRTIYAQHVPYQICGVVEDVNPLFKNTTCELFMPLGPKQKEQYPGAQEFSGNIQAKLLLKPGASVDAIRREVESRYATANQRLKDDKWELIYHGQPYDSKTLAAGEVSTNITPDLKAYHTRNLLIFAFMMILPAINLSSMTRSRLRRRVSEIGVRRAFGARKVSIIAQLLGENMIITVIGGAIGLLLSTVFMLVLFDLFFGSRDTNSMLVSPTPNLEMLFTWRTFAIALAFCFILNMLSAFVPAWRASCVHPAEAIAKSKQ